MVLLSPAPTEIDLVRAERILVVTGGFDLPRIQTFIPELETLRLYVFSVPLFFTRLTIAGY